MTIPFAGGIGLATRTGGQQDLTPVDYFGPVLATAAQDAWTEYRPQLQEFLQLDLGRGDLLAPGVTLYDLDVRISPDITFSVDRDDKGDLLVHLTTGGCYIEATSTTPSVFGSDFDPRFSVAFGLDLTYGIDLPPVTQPLVATGLKSVRVLAPHFDSHNFIGDLISMVNDIVGWFDGPNYIGQLERFIAQTDFAKTANAQLGPVNEKLTTLAAQGFWFLEAVVDQLDGASGELRGLSLPGAPADQLNLLLMARGYDRSGVIEGEITWPQTLGGPTNRPELSLAKHARVSQLNNATASAIVLADAPGTWESASAIRANIGGVAGDQGQAAVAAAASADGSATAISEHLGSLSTADATVVATQLRSGVASQFVSIIGAEAFKELQWEFLHGRSDFVVTVTTSVPVEGALLPESRVAGRMTTLWEADDETTCRRRFTVVDVATDAPLLVTAALADGYRWVGEVTDVSAAPDHWNGFVTVRKAELNLRDRVFDDQVELTVEGARRFGTRSSLEERGIIIVSGSGVGDEVSLNPQPLPPREIATTVGGALEAIRAGASDTVSTGSVLARLRDRRWSRATIDVNAPRIDLEALVQPVRENPSGSGTVTGIDFVVGPTVHPDVR